MSYKTVLVHVDKSRHAAERLRLATAIAREEGAHLIGAAATGVSRYIYQAGMLGDGAAYTAHLEAHMDVLREQGKTILDELEAISRRFGLWVSEQVSMTKKGASGAEEIRAMMGKLRSAPPSKVGPFDVTAFVDVAAGTRVAKGGKPEPITLPKSDVLVFELAGGSRYRRRRIEAGDAGAEQGRRVRHGAHEVHAIAQPLRERGELDAGGDRHNDTATAGREATQCFTHLLRLDREHQRVGLSDVRRRGIETKAFRSQGADIVRHMRIEDDDARGRESLRQPAGEQRAAHLAGTSEDDGATNLCKCLRG